MQLTFVSHYGPKPAPFVEKIRLLQSMIAEQLGGRFEPYTVEQVHGTVIGLEGARSETRIRNENFRRFRGTERFIDFQGLLDFLRTRPESDSDVRIGGYDLACDYGFTSSGQHPFLRSFSIRGEIAVAMGWPQSLGTVVPSLDELRGRSSNSAPCTSGISANRMWTMTSSLFSGVCHRTLNRRSVIWCSKSSANTSPPRLFSCR